jgi:hypothetical protein
MGQPFGRSHHVGADRIKRQRLFAWSKNHIAAHTGREIYDNVDFGTANAFYYFAI